MFATALRYGAVSGGIVIAVIILGIVLSTGQGHGHAFSSQWLGYLVMIVALSMIFLAIRDYRNKIYVDNIDRISCLKYSQSYWFNSY